MALDLVPLQIGGIPGGMELAVILLIAILLFGANKIPKLARSTGQAIGEFKRGRQELEQELEEVQKPADVDETPTTTTETTTESSSSVTDGGSGDEDETDESK